MQLFQAKEDVQLCGLVGFLDNCKSRTILTIELQNRKQGDAESTPTSATVVVLRRELSVNSNSGFIEAQRIPIKEKSLFQIASFAVLPSGNVLCAMVGFRSVHELKRLSRRLVDREYSVYSKVHAMPAKVRTICSIKTSDEWRLVTSFVDNSIRIFKMTSGRLEPTGSLAAPARDYWRPFSLASVSSGLLLVSDLFSAASTTVAVDCFSFGAAGFSAPRRLVENSPAVVLLHACRQPSGRVALVAYEKVKEILVVYEFDQQ